MEAVGQFGTIEIAANKNNAAGPRLATPGLRRAQFDNVMHSLQNVAARLPLYCKNALHAKQLARIR